MFLIDFELFFGINYVTEVNIEEKIIDELNNHEENKIDYENIMFDDYIKCMEKNFQWGDNYCIQAFSVAYQINVLIVNNKDRNNCFVYEFMIEDNNTNKHKQCKLMYNGYHYNLLIKDINTANHVNKTELVYGNDELLKATSEVRSYKR
jgi:hypothetical protein